MSGSRTLPTSGLGKKYLEFLNAWEIDNRGVFVPPAPGLRSVYAWAGKFNFGETVIIAANEPASTEMEKSDLYVGIVEENFDLNPSATDEQAAINVDCATQFAPGGVRSAIYMLNLLRGLPDGSRLNICPPARFRNLHV